MCPLLQQLDSQTFDVLVVGAGINGTRAPQHLEAKSSDAGDYSARRRSGKPISTAFVESAVKEIVSRRMIKKQQMRWNRWTVQPFLNATDYLQLLG